VISGTLEGISNSYVTSKESLNLKFHIVDGDVHLAPSDGADIT
jgi:hypothetical protein